MALLQCLIVAQPYASLIAVGCKRWEFRGYESKKTGKIGIAASNVDPWLTRNVELNKISHLFPRGMVLATADLVTSFFVASEDLKKKITAPVQVSLHGHSILTCGEPIGEPLEDVNTAIADRNWRSFAWLLENVKILDPPISFERDGRSTWVTVEIP
jgi:hypothetical protein